MTVSVNASAVGKVFSKKNLVQISTFQSTSCFRHDIWMELSFHAYILPPPCCSTFLWVLVFSTASTSLEMQCTMTSGTTQQPLIRYRTRRLPHSEKPEEIISCGHQQCWRVIFFSINIAVSCKTNVDISFVVIKVQTKKCVISPIIGLQA